jgi:methyl-accepting chemotaxis protein
MKFSRKLLVAFGSILLLMLCGAILSNWNLHGTINSLQMASARGVAEQDQIQNMHLDFKSQVQEWKNVLLRGKDASALSKHWLAFEGKEQAVAGAAARLRLNLASESARAMLDKFLGEHQKMSAAYRKGLAAFKEAGMDPVAGDKAVQGLDRAPGELLFQIASTMEKDSAALQDTMDQRSRRSLWAGIALLLGVFAVGTLTAWILTRQMMRLLGGEPSEAAKMADAIAQGNLQSAFALDPQDQTSLIARLVLMQTSLAHVVNDVRRNADGVATASAQIAQGNGDLAARTEEQAASLQKTASSMEQLSATMLQNADNAKQANQLALGASSVAVRGGEVVGQVVDTMKGINESSRKIADIISVIDGIAFQTNILALNAAVEAARAGEQGRGFAVVASEVRSLAGRSAEAAKEIKSLIGASVERVEQGTALVDEAGATMGEVVSAIRRVTDIMGEINLASSEQSIGVSQVNQAVTQMDSATQQNAALVEQSAAAAESLKNQAQHLVQSVAMFRSAP